MKKLKTFEAFSFGGNKEKERENKIIEEIKKEIQNGGGNIFKGVPVGEHLASINFIQVKLPGNNLVAEIFNDYKGSHINILAPGKTPHLKFMIDRNIYNEFENSIKK